MLIHRTIPTMIIIYLFLVSIENWNIWVATSQVDWSSVLTHWKSATPALWWVDCWGRPPVGFWARATRWCATTWWQSSESRTCNQHIRSISQKKTSWEKHAGRRVAKINILNSHGNEETTSVLLHVVRQVDSANADSGELLLFDEGLQPAPHDEGIKKGWQQALLLSWKGWKRVAGWTLFFLLHQRFTHQDFYNYFFVDTISSPD